MAYVISGAIVVVSLVAVALYVAYKEDRLLDEIQRRIQALECGEDEKEKVGEKAE